MPCQILGSLILSCVKIQAFMNNLANPVKTTCFFNTFSVPARRPLWSTHLIHLACAINVSISNSCVWRIHIFFYWWVTAWRSCRRLAGVSWDACCPVEEDPVESVHVPCVSQCSKNHPRGVPLFHIAEGHYQSSLPSPWVWHFVKALSCVGLLWIAIWVFPVFTGKGSAGVTTHQPQWEERLPSNGT